MIQIKRVGKAWADDHAVQGLGKVAIFVWSTNVEKYVTGYESAYTVLYFQWVKTYL